MENLLNVGSIVTYFFMAIGLVWVAFEVVRWVSEGVTALGLSSLFMGFFRGIIGFAVFCIAYWTIAPLLNLIIPETDLGIAIFAAISIIASGIAAGLAASFVLFRWIRAGIIKLFKSFPGSDKLKLFIVAIVILVLAIFIFM